MNSRAKAALIFSELLFKGVSLGELIPEEEKEKPLLQELCFGTARWYFYLKPKLDSLLKNPIKKKDNVLYALLLIGLYQLLFMQKPAHAVLNETVAAVHDLNRPFAGGLVNAVLRNFLRMPADTIDDSKKHAHPEWLRKKIFSAWPAEADKILLANNQRPPMVLRVNAQHLTREEYLTQLHSANLPATLHPIAGIELAAPVPVQQLPGFYEGLVSVQDASAQLAAQLLNPNPNDRLLDACAAPGMKTCHLLEREPSCDCTAIDINPLRCLRIKENLQRLSLKAIVKTADILSFCDKEGFDRILLDAPCSATGVIRRHPDIKLLRRESDIHTLSLTQLNCLTAAWRSLKAGGILLYATCSILPEENEEVIQAFLATTPAVSLPIDLPVGQTLTYGKQILPGEYNMDGFYYALLQRPLGKS